MTKRILVTGGLGYIGSHTVVELIKTGYEVVIVDDLSNSRFSVLSKIEALANKKPIFYQLDVNNVESLRRVFKEQVIDGVIHFAAYKSVNESLQKPLAYYRNNISALVGLLEVMEENNVVNFIFSSSCTVYGQANEMPIKESTHLKPATTSYGNTKKIGEEILRDVCLTDKLKAISLRYFNPIGAHKSALIGELPLGTPQNLIPFLTQTVAGLRKELQVFGNDYNTKDGSAVRDYIHVVDLAKAHILALNRLTHNKNERNFEFYNVGTGEGTSVLEIIKYFEEVTNEKVPHKIVARREGDIEVAFADTTLITEKMGWKPENTVKDALLDAWKWQLSLKAL